MSTNSPDQIDESKEGENTSEISGHSDAQLSEPWETFVGQQVVIDTASRYVYLGTLIKRTSGSLVLEEVDVHDSYESESTKEVYIMEAAKHGIRVNRKKVLLPEHRVLSISKLDDTVLY